MSAYCSADVVNIDIGRSANTSTGNINNITELTPNGVVTGGVASGGTALALIDDTGAVTPYSVTLNTDNIPNDVLGIAGAGADFAGPFPAAISGQPLTALQDGIFLRDEGDPSEFVNLVFSGLSSAETYSFTLYGARGNNGLVTNATATSGSPSATGSLDPFQNSSQLIVFNNLLADANGEIELAITAPGTSQSGSINFVQLVSAPLVVPEPSSGLICLAGVVLCGLRRRR